MLRRYEAILKNAKRTRKIYFTDLSNKSAYAHVESIKLNDEIIVDILVGKFAN
jgi:hypothetical protein